jgi:hypothetical protein
MFSDYKLISARNLAAGADMEKRDAASAVFGVIFVLSPVHHGGVFAVCV